MPKHIKMHNSFVKELVVTLNTMESNETSVTTPVINGILKCVIILCGKPASVSIFHADYPTIELFNDKQFQGAKYLPLRIDAVNKDHERYNFSPQEWALNNALGVHLEGNRMTEATIIFRYVEG